jgi:HEAT repeat protein
MQSDPDRAFPLLESLLKSAQPPRIRRQAVFVLAQSNSPKAQTLLEQVAKGQGNPDLQLSAIRYLGEKRRQGGSNPILGEIYSGTSDQNVKRAVLQAFENARDKDRLLQIAKTEQNQDLRLHAIRMLGSIQGTQAEMWALFQAESTADGKQMILESMPSAGNQDKMLEVARTEKDPKVRRFAIHNLGSTRAATTGDTLAQIYSSEQDQEVKRAIVDALANQKNAKALITAAKGENDARMKQRIIERIVSLKTPEGNDYLMELLKK